MTHLIHRDLRRAAPAAMSGQGIWLTGADGHRVMDGSGGAAVACLGHGHPHVLAAMHKQLDRLTYAHTSLFTNQAAEALADMLVGHAQGGFCLLYTSPSPRDS